MIEQEWWRHCKRCGVYFERKPGTAGQFCTVACYRRETVGASFAGCATMTAAVAQRFMATRIGKGTDVSKVEGIEVRYAQADDGHQEFDEIVARDAVVHLEKLNAAEFFLGITTPTESAKFSIRAWRSRIDASEYDREHVPSPAAASIEQGLKEAIAYARVGDTGPTLPRVEPAEVAAALGAEPVIPRCPEFRPDHNGECLNCDEWADMHDDAALAPGVLAAIQALCNEAMGQPVDALEYVRELLHTVAKQQRQLAAEGREHTECQDALVKAQAEIVSLKARVEAIQSGWVKDKARAETVASGWATERTWRSMTTAPKPKRKKTDPATWVMLDHEDFVLPVFAYWDGTHWRDDVGGMVRRIPRGWMPVPERVR